MTDINYVMACYFGERDSVASGYASDPLFYVKRHITSLEVLSHGLSQITVMCSGEDPGLRLPTQIGNTKVVSIVRPNMGLSYGAFSDAYERYREDFSHYIFTEDDYMFTHDGFDQLLINEYDRKKCGSLCGYAARTVVDQDPTNFKEHAAVFIALSGSNVLEKARKNIYCKEERLPYLERPDMYAGYFAQKAMSFAIVDTGHLLTDWTERWSTAYWDSTGKIIRWFGGQDEPWLGDTTKRSFIVPMQAIGQPCKVSDGKNWHFGLVDEHGSFTEMQEPGPEE